MTLSQSNLPRTGGRAAVKRMVKPVQTSSNQFKPVQASPAQPSPVKPVARTYSTDQLDQLAQLDRFDRFDPPGISIGSALDRSASSTSSTSSTGSIDRIVAQLGHRIGDRGHWSGDRGHWDALRVQTGLFTDRTRA